MKDKRHTPADAIQKASDEAWEHRYGKRPESTADFKARLAAMLKPQRDTDRPCVRKPTDDGYYPPARKVGSGQPTIQQDDSTGIVERPKTSKSTRKTKIQ